MGLNHKEQRIEGWLPKSLVGGSSYSASFLDIVKQISSQAHTTFDFDKACLSDVWDPALLINKRLTLYGSSLTVALIDTFY